MTVCSVDSFAYDSWPSEKQSSVQMSVLGEERAFNSSLKHALLVSSVCPSKAETELPPNIMSQNNVYTLH